MTNDHSLTQDEIKKIKAMYHLESCFTAKGVVKPDEWTGSHIWAAHYIIQSMFNGCMPNNYDEVIKAAERLDAIDEANDAILRAKNPNHFDDKIEN